MFATTLHRLRKLLGVNEALVLEDGRLSLDPRYCWVDARAFEKLLDDAEVAAKGASRGAGAQDRAAAAASAERALALYRGAFLGQTPAPP